MSDTATETNATQGCVEKEALQLGASFDYKNLPSGVSGINTFANSAGSFRRVTQDSTPRDWGADEAKALRSALIS